MSPLTDNLRRWVRLQRELGLDEVFLDEPWAPPVDAPVRAIESRAPAPAATVGSPRMAPREPAPPRTTPPPALERNAPVRATGPASQGFQFQPPGRAPMSTTAASPATVKAPVPRTAAARPASIPAFPDLAAMQEHMRACNRCILHGKRRAVIVGGGAPTSSWAILTLYGWADDDKSGELLSGTYAQAFLDLVTASGLPRPAILPLLACTPADPADTTIQGFTEAVRCRPHWTQGLKLVGAKAILVLDHKATQFARGPAAPVSWPAFRGEEWSLEGLPAISTHHPARLARSAPLGPEVAADLARLKSLLESRP